jgi:hypothetical protein
MSFQLIQLHPPKGRMLFDTELHQTVVINKLFSTNPTCVVGRITILADDSKPNDQGKQVSRLFSYLL